MTGEKQYRTFREFWPFYVREHSHSKNRMLHAVGSIGVILTLAAAVVLGKPLLLVLIPLCGYGFAWYGHFFVQRNVPATFTYPLWSLLADFKMLAFMLSGRMRGEVERACAREPLSSRPGPSDLRK